MPFDDRDPKFERALAHHLRSGAAQATCPDAETLAAYHERNLSLEEMARWKEHISTCEACQEALALVETTEKQLAEDWERQREPVLELLSAPRVQAAASAAERTAQAAASPVAFLRRRPLLLRWAIPLGAVAAGVLVFIGFYEQRAYKLAPSSSAVVARREVPATPAPMRDQLQSKVQESSESKDSKDKELESAERSVQKEEKTILAAPSPRPVDGIGSSAGIVNGNRDYGAAAKKAITVPPSAPDISAAVVAGDTVTQNAPIRAAGGGGIGATSGGGFVNLPTNGRNVVGLMTLSPSVVLAPNQIGGVVIDPSGAVIASAIVEVKNLTTNATWSASTSSDGRWLLPNLPSGTYQLSVHAPGFQTMSSTIAYDAANPLAYQIGLNVGAVTDTVEVSAQSVAVDTESAKIAGRKKKKNAPQPAAPPPPHEPTTHGAGAAVGGAAGGQKASADEKSVPPAATESVAPSNGRDDRMMMKQGVSSQAVEGTGSASGLILTPDNRVFWKLQPAGTVQLTTDGGKDWKSLETGANEYLTTGFAPSSNVCWIAGKSGTLLLTKDRGSHWSKISTPIAGDLGGVHAADAKHASIWDSTRHTSYETSDGGSTWKQTSNQ